MVIPLFQSSTLTMLLPRGDAPRVARRLPLAIIFRAFGACLIEFRLLNQGSTGDFSWLPSDGLRQATVARTGLRVLAQVADVVTAGWPTIVRRRHMILSTTHFA